MDSAVDALQAVDGLCDDGVDEMVVIDVEVSHNFHFQGVEIDVKGEEVEGEIFYFDVLHNFEILEVLFCCHCAFGPEDGVEFPILVFFDIPHNKFS